MVKTQSKSVDKYIASQPEDVQKALTRVRAVIRKALPAGAGSDLLQYADIQGRRCAGAPIRGWAGYFSLYGATSRVVAAFKDDLARYKVNKGTIRFPLPEPVPEQLTERIAKFRAGESAPADDSQSGGLPDAACHRDIARRIACICKSVRKPRGLMTATRVP